MSFQEQLISNMFDSEAKNVRNAGQQALAQGTIAQQALWTYDAAGNLVMRDVDEALAIARGIQAMNQVQAPAPASTVTIDDLAQAVLALATKIEAWTTVTT
jgi:hypothetical protein